MIKHAGEEPKLTAIQEKTIFELINPENKSIVDVAKKLQIPRQTIYNWFDQPIFQALLNKERNRTREHIFEQLNASLGNAISCLNNLLQDRSKQIRLKACSMLLDYNTKMAEIKEIEERVSKLERGVQGTLDEAMKKFKEILGIQSH